MNWDEPDNHKLLLNIAAQYSGTTEKQMERCMTTAVATGNSKAYAAAVGTINALVANGYLKRANGEWFLTNPQERAGKD